MEKIAKEVKREIEPWQQEDADRLLAIFQGKKVAAKRLGGEKLTQEWLAEKAGINSSSMVWQYLHGHRALNIKAAGGFARALGVQVEDFSPTLAEQIAAMAASVSATEEEAPGGYSLSVEKLVLINAINEKEAAMLRRYRMADDQSIRMIDLAFSSARPRGLAIVDDDQAEQGPAGAG